MSYTITDFTVGDRVEWMRWNMNSSKTTKRQGTVTIVGKAKITVHMDDTNQVVVVWPRNIANLTKGE
jgi:hypothetical protein